MKMNWNQIYHTFCFILVFAETCCSGPTRSSSPSDSDTCRPIHFNCGSDDRVGQNTRERLVGPPGKQGIPGVGVPGPRGPQGPKGEEGKYVDKNSIQSNILQMFSVASCEELRTKHGVTVTGHYLMRSEDVEWPIYVHCDFQYRTGVKTCRDLNYNSESLETGYYLVNNSKSSEPEYIYCDFKIYEDTSSCDQLKTTSNVKRPGYYRIRSNVASEPKFIYCDIIERQGVTTCFGLQKIYRLHEAADYVLKLTPTSQPLKLFCNFSAVEVVTQVSHNIENEIKNPNRCGGQGCYSINPAYNLSDEHILQIITNSRECRQFIKIRCTGVMFLSDSYAWWVSRSDEKMTYWGGASSRRDKYCACGETGTCLKTNLKCNCDSNDINILTGDEGFLTDKTKLPVKQIRLGDQDDNGEQAWHTLGKLECFGEA